MAYRGYKFLSENKFKVSPDVPTNCQTTCQDEELRKIVWKMLTEPPEPGRRVGNCGKSTFVSMRIPECSIVSMWTPAVHYCLYEDTWIYLFVSTPVVYYCLNVDESFMACMRTHGTYCLFYHVTTVQKQPIHLCVWNRVCSQLNPWSGQVSFTSHLAAVRAWGISAVATVTCSSVYLEHSFRPELCLRPLRNGYFLRLWYNHCRPLKWGINLNVAYPYLINYPLTITTGSLFHYFLADKLLI